MLRAARSIVLVERGDDGGHRRVRLDLRVGEHRAGHALTCLRDIHAELAVLARIRSGHHERREVLDLVSARRRNVGVGDGEVLLAVPGS